MTFREQLAVIRDMAAGALVRGDLDDLEVRQQICDMLYSELVDLDELAEAGNGADE